MQEFLEAELLRVFVGEGEKLHGRPLYEVIVEAALKQGIAGATVSRGLLSYGVHGQIHAAKILRLAEDLPMIIEIVDQPEKIAAFLPDLGALVGAGLVTLEKVRVVRFMPDASATGVVGAGPMGSPG